MAKRKAFSEIVKEVNEELLPFPGLKLSDEKLADKEIICKKVYGDFLITCWCARCYNNQKCEAKHWEWEKRLKKSTWINYGG